MQEQGTPASRAIQLATRLADVIADGVPLDAESLAAGILAEAVSSGGLSTGVVEAQLGTAGPGVAKLLNDIMRVRALPQRLNIYDDEATRYSNFSLNDGVHLAILELYTLILSSTYIVDYTVSTACLFTAKSVAKTASASQPQLKWCSDSHVSCQSRLVRVN